MKALKFSSFFSLPGKIMQGPKNLKKYFMYLSKAVDCIPLLFWITHLHDAGRLWQFTTISNEENYITQIPANQTGHLLWRTS